MAWPLSQDYNEAIQDPASSFSDPELRAGEATTNALGMPMPRSGNFADVYEFNCAATKSKWAIKCFTRHVSGLRERYTEISAGLSAAKLPFAVDFQYLVQGIRVRGDWFPILKMRWVEGFLLNEFVRDNLDKPALLGNLGLIWGRMAKRLREASIAHADLQHGNVILVPGSKASSLAVKLIDYDGMFVPALASKKSGEVGHPNYQHPQRLREGIYSAEVDRFPLLVVATALRALSVAGRELWERYDNSDNLLFRESDLQAPGKSALFTELHNLADPQTRMLAEELHRAAERSLEQVPRIDELLAESKAAKATSPLAPGKPPIEPKRSEAETPAEVAPVAAEMAPPPGPPMDIEQEDAEPKPKSSVSKGGVPKWAWVVGGGAVAGLLVVAVSIAVVMMVFFGGDRKKDKDVVVQGKEKPAKVNPPKEGKKKVPAGGGDPVVPRPPVKRFPATVPANTKANWHIEGDELVQDVLVPDLSIFFGDPRWTDFDFSVDAKLIKHTHGFALWFRNTDDQTADMFALGAYGNIRHVLHSKRGGNWNDRVSKDIQNEPLQTDRWYSAKVSVRGENGSCFLDGAKVFDFNVERRAGGVGLRTWNASCHFKNIRVTAPDGTVLLEGLPNVVPTPAPQAGSGILALNGQHAPELILELPKNLASYCLSADGRRIAYTTGQHGVLFFREAPRFDVERKVDISNAKFLRVLSSSLDGKKMVLYEHIGGAAGKILIFDWDALKVDSWVPTTFQMERPVLSPDKKYLAYGGVQFERDTKVFTHSVTLCELATRKDLRRWETTKSPIAFFAFTPDSSKLFYREWSKDSCDAYTVEGLVASTFKFGKEIAQFSPDFTHVARWSGPQVRIVEADTQRVLATLRTPGPRVSVRAAAFSADNRLMLVNTEDFTNKDPISQVFLIDTKGGEVIAGTEPRDGANAVVQVASNGIGVVQTFQKNQAPVSVYRFSTEAPVVPVANADGFVPLFNGKDLTGWKKHPTHPGDWSVIDGILTGKSADRGVLLTNRADYKDFHLRLEARTRPDGASGVFFRNSLTYQGYEALFYKGMTGSTSVSINNADKATSRSYREGKPLAAIPAGWFKVDIIVQGKRVRVQINGVTTTDFVDDKNDLSTGIIGLRDEKGSAEYRNIEIKELNADAAPPPVVATEGFTPLFNGKDLAGLRTHLRMPGTWSVVNGLLVSTGGDSDYLYAPHSDYKDFHLRLEARVSKGAFCEVNFRNEFDSSKWRPGEGRMTGYRAILASEYVGLGKIGTLHTREPNNTAVTSNSNMGPVPEDEWVTLEVIAIGNRLTTKVNGKTAATYVDPKKRFETGHIFFRTILNGPHIEFRKIEIKELNRDPRPILAVQGFTPLFNGTDLTGWQPHPNFNGKWLVENGILTPTGVASLHTTRDDYKDYHLHVEARAASANANGAIWSRVKPDFPGYRISINNPKTNTAGGVHIYSMTSITSKGAGVKVPLGEWFDLDIFAVANRITVNVNGKKTADFVDNKNGARAGKIGLQQVDKTSIEFRKIEIKELDGGGGAAPVVVARAVAVPLNLDDELKADDPKDAKNRSPARRFTLKLTKDKKYQIDLRSKDFDSYLRLLDSAGTEVAFDDDGGGALDARITYTVRKTDDYTIVATTFNRKVGTFNLKAVDVGAPQVVKENPPKQKDDPPPKVVRLPVPDAGKVAQAEKTIHDQFKKEYAKKASADMIALAEKLLQLSKDIADNPTDCFALLRETRSVATKAGAVELAMKATREMTARFAVDELATRVDTFVDLGKAKLNTDNTKQLVEAALANAASALADDHFEASSKIIAAAEAALFRNKNAVLMSQVKKQDKQIKDLAKDYGEMKKAQEKLRADAKDPGANLTVGAYLAFRKGDWDKGLPLLALGSQADLQDLAKKELAMPKNEKAYGELADAWWAGADKKPAYQKTAMHWRAAHWYRQALPSLTGLAQTRAADRVKQIDALPAPFKVAGAVGEVDRFRGHTGAVNWLSLSADGKRLFSGGAEGTLREWTLATGRSRVILGQQYTKAPVVAFAMSPDERSVALLNPDGLLIPLDLTTLKAGRSDREAVPGFYWSNNSTVAYAHRTSWNTWAAFKGSSSGGGIVFGGARVEANVTALAMAPDHEAGAVLCSDGTAVAFRMRDNGSRMGITSIPFDATAAALPKDAKFIVLGGKGGKLHSFNLRGNGNDVGKETHSFKGHTGTIRCIACSTDGQRVVSGSTDRTARIWDAALGKELQRLPHPSAVTAVLVTLDNRYVITACADSIIRVWSLTSAPTP